MIRAIVVSGWLSGTPARQIAANSALDQRHVCRKCSTNVRNASAKVRLSSAV